MAVSVRDSLPLLHRSGALGDSVKEVLRACCALPAKSRARAPDEFAVHRARRALKRARAVLRLGETLGIKGAKSARRRLARLARELSPLRDTVVAAKVADRLGRKLEGRLRPAAGDLGAIRSAGGSVSWWRLWKRKLHREIRVLDRLDWDELSTRDLRRALRRSVKRVCRRARQARKSEIATLHEWRKAAIVLREQVSVMRPLLGPEAESIHSPLHRLTRRLGRAMDCEVFIAALRRSPKQLGESGAQLGRLARKRQRHALRRACRCWPKTKRVLEHAIA